MPIPVHSAAVSVAALLLAGCGGKVMAPTPSAQATEQWNAARAGALAGLAADQLRDGNFDKCQATLDQVLRLTPGDVKLHLLAAKLSIEQGQLELADAHLAEARRLDSKNAEADYLTGLLMERWQQFDRAQAAYADAAEKNPAEVAYLLAQAETLVALKKPTDALALLQTKLSHFEHSGLVRQEIGLLQVALGKTDDALESLPEACRLTPDDPTVREHLAFALFSATKYADAADVFGRLVKQPEYETRPDVQAALGECMARTQRYYEAQKADEIATKLDGSTPGYWLGLGRVALQAGDVPTADVAVRKAVSLRPADSGTQGLVGYVRLKQNQLQQALVATDLDPKDAASLSLQGYVLTRMGRAAEAHECYARALLMEPDSPLTGRLIATIGSPE